MSSVEKGTARERVLVTGGAGFLGANLCRRLLREGHEVICMDNFLTGKQSNIDELMANHAFSLLRHDVIDPMPADIEPTRIYNLACAASPRHYQADPIHTVRTCVDGAYNVLELARRCGARVLQASTSEVYGDPQEHPQHESYRGHVNIVGLRSCYDEGKRCAETLFADYGRCKGVQVKIARIFNTYGPYMSADDGRVVSNFITQALAGSKLTIYGDGAQTRALCYVDDLIEGLVRLMDSVATFQGPVNLGGTQEITVKEIAQHVCALTGAKLRFEHLPLPPDDPVQRLPVIVLAERHLGWRPQVALAQGLQRTIAYFSAI